jgi:hypothetical protein
MILMDNGNLQFARDFTSDLSDAAGRPQAQRRSRSAYPALPILAFEVH